jgi:hypothetical protein
MSNMPEGWLRLVCRGNLMPCRRVSASPTTSTATSKRLAMLVIPKSRVAALQSDKATARGRFRETPTKIILAVAMSLLLPGQLSAQTAADFKDGLGYYVLNDGQYQMLFWQSQLGQTANSSAVQSILAAVPSAIPIKRSARFFTYGVDFTTGIYPPNLLLGFCALAPNASQGQINGAFPVRVRPIRVSGMFSGMFSAAELPIYELVPPDFLRTSVAIEKSQLYWSLGLQDNCTKGWLFKIID